MVMFTCNRCSAALKKSQVENHAFQCGGPSKISLTCHDCLKDFRGKEYESHTSCISEEARYGGKGVIVKEAGKKQNKWCEVVQDVLANNNALDPAVHKFLKNAVHLQNIPRKRPQFVNWAKNAMRCFDYSLIDKVFDVLIAEFSRLTTSPSQQPKIQTDSTKKGRSDESSALGESEKANEGGASNEDNPSRNGVDEIRGNDANGERNTKKKKNKKHNSNGTAEGLDEEMKGENDEPMNGPGNNGVVEIIGNGEVPKKKDKKNKKKSIEDTGENSLDVAVESIADDSQNEVRKNKKKKKKSADVAVTEEPMEGLEESPVVTSDVTAEFADDSQNEIRKNKKKKKKSADVAVAEEPMEGLEESPIVASDVPAEVAQPAKKTDSQAATQKLSKKERKLLKKKAKFEAEVAEIESFKTVEEGREEVVEEESPKKSKKRKNGIEEETEGQKGDGAKKRKLEADELEKEEPPEEEESHQKVKFDWHGNILAVLRKSKNDEVPVKKVSKRVIDEYVSQYGDKAIHEKLHAKMNKKLQTCPGVRVLKDKVKLLEIDR